MGQSSRIILVPFAAQGHVSSMLHLARVLHARGFDVTVATPDFVHCRLFGKNFASGVPRCAISNWGTQLLMAQRGTPLAKFFRLVGLDGCGIRFEPLASGIVADVTARHFAAIDGAMESRMPAELERLLLAAEGAVACVVADMVASWALDVAQRCRVPVVAGYWSMMLATYRVISAIPELIRAGFISEYGSLLHRQTPSRYQEQVEEALTLAAQAKLRPNELPWLVSDLEYQKSKFKFFLRILDRAKTLQYLLVNSFPDEAGQPTNLNPLPSLQALPIGPLIAHQAATANRANDQPPSMWEADRTCLRWLEKQPPNSVVYVSFGSWVEPITPENIAEFASGLELAEQPFLWVLRDDKSWRSGLPPGFLERIGERGMVVAWTSQEEVLGSPAIACYLCHCGWNSALEAIKHEKRLLCYPIAGDQFVNAAFIVEVWRIGAKIESCDRFGIADGIKRIMRSSDGVRLQESLLQFKRTVMGEHAGPPKSLENLQLFVDIIKKNTKHEPPKCICSRPRS